MLVAFPGEVNDMESGPEPFTETSKELNAGLNGGDIREAFKLSDYHILLVANKFQTGFDQPLLCGTYRVVQCQPRLLLVSSGCAMPEGSSLRRDQIDKAMLLNRDTLHSGASEALREMIMSGEMAPGSKVHEVELCERLGISRTPLREALKGLASEGLVQLVPRRGAFVAQITEAEIDELFPIMAALEGLAVELAMIKLTDADIETFLALHRDLFALYEAGEESEYLRLNRQIHRHFFTVAGNNALTSLYEHILARSRSVRFVIRKTPEQWRQAVEEHRMILAAIEVRDCMSLADLMRQHLLGTAAAIARHALPQKG